jgi:hypothetical protein
MIVKVRNGNERMDPSHDCKRIRESLTFHPGMQRIINEILWDRVRFVEASQVQEQKEASRILTFVICNLINQLISFTFPCVYRNNAVL